MAVSFDPTQDVKKVAANQRALAQSKGDDLSAQFGGEVGANEDLRNQYRARLDSIMDPMAQGQGGYSPEEVQAIEAKGGMPQSLTDEQAAGNFLTPDEQAGIKGDTGSYTRNFNPDQMSQDQTVSAGKQRQAVNNLKQGLAGDINNDALSQSGAFQQDSEHQLKLNQDAFGNVIGAEGGNVRGAIDPSKVTASDSFLKDYQMSPEEKQNIVTGAGISAGARDAAAVDANERAARAAGSSPGGVAAYRARMARAGAADAGDAMTQARIAASNADAARKMSGEQLREQGGQYLTNVKTGTELQMGQDALKGTAALGDQALGQRNTVEGQRLAAEQAKTGINLGATEAGGAADIATEGNINSQGRQQEQFNTTTGTGIAEAQDTANSGRAASVAGDRQQTAVTNQGTQFNQNKTNNDTGSTRATGVANTRLNAQQQGLNYYQGQNAQANANAEAGQNREVSTYGTQAGATNNAAQLGADAAKQPGTFSKVMGAVSGGLGAAASFLDEGGIATEPTLAVVGEHGPEWVGKLQSGLKTAAGTMSGMSGSKPNPWQQLGDSAAKVGNAYRARKLREADPATAMRDPSKSNPGAYGPANPAGSMTNFPQPAPQAMDEVPRPDEQDDGAPEPMADGRIVTKPTLALIGEDGPEQVVPMGYRARAKVRPSMAFGSEAVRRGRIPYQGAA